MFRARMYDEVSGSGPVLMLIGHPMDMRALGSLISTRLTSSTIAGVLARGEGGR